MVLKKNLAYLFVFLFCVTKAQDKIYFLNGTSKTGTITEISEEQITAQLSKKEKQAFDRSSILLIEFKNGSVEIITRPKENVLYNPVEAQNQLKPAKKQEFVFSNFGSLNTLALCNADISGFFEHVLSNRLIGVGVMGAYNFNERVSLSNLFIAPLTSARKKYDLGAFVNFYLDGLSEEETTFYYGLLFKYMNFDFTKVTEVTTTTNGFVSTSFKYTRTSGSQLATLFTFGTHSNITKKFFVKSIFGIGGFNMRGDYKEQYNYFIQKNTGLNDDRKFLLKLYFGFNAGFAF